MCVVVDGDIIIYLIKAYYSDSKELMKTMQKLKNRSEDNNKENIMLKSFIIESFVWKGTQIVIKCENLNRLCLFVSKKSINYLIKFITWMGDLRPIGFNPTNI